VQYCLPAAAVAFDWTKLLILCGRWVWASSCIARRAGVALHVATDIPFSGPKSVRSSPGLLESGLLGFWRLRIVMPRHYLALANLITA
jgi:hypothetical protein